MDRNKAKEIQARAVAALRKEFGAEFVISAAGGQVADIKTILKFEFRSANTEETKVAERKAFEAYAKFASLEPGDYEREFNVQGYTYAICGIALNRPKFPIDAKRTDGKMFKFTSETVRRSLGRK